ncbi:unnamed protein product [Dicrocoelium dendriticum]|nr:unnamed protein product [Dicrocoelium dendriticum]
MHRKPIFTSPCVGGILADEMGLGKTLEVIALIATRPWIGWSTDVGLIRTLDGHPLPACNEMDDAPTPPMIDADPDGFVLRSCGNVDATRGFDLVKCTRCDGPYQHAACVQYEPEKFSPLPGKYGCICPPCCSKMFCQQDHLNNLSPITLTGTCSLGYPTWRNFYANMS